MRVKLTPVLTPQGEKVRITGDTYRIKDYIKKCGGQWDPEKKAWYVSREKARELILAIQGLTDIDDTEVRKHEEMRKKAMTKLFGGE